MSVSTCSGFIYKEGESWPRGWKKRYCEIYGYNMLYYTSEDANNESLKGVVKLIDCTIANSVHADDGKFGFQINMPGANARAYVLCVDSKEDRTRWIQALQLAARGPPEPTPPDNSRAEAAEAQCEALEKRLFAAVREKDDTRCALSLVGSRSGQQ